VALSSIDPVKYVASKFGWQGEKDDKARRMLSNLKDMLTEYNDFPFHTVTNYLSEVSHIADMPTGTKYLFYCVQSREPDDIKKYQNYFSELNPKTVLVERKEAHLATPNNHADQGVFGFRYDLYIPNNSSLKNFKKEIVRNLFK